MRREGRRNARLSRRSELARIEQALSLRLWSWARADTVTTTGSNIDSWPDRVAAGLANAKAIDPSHAYSAAGALRGTVGTGIAGRPTCVLAGAQRYTSSLAAASWAFTADGSGIRIVCVAKSTASGTQALYGTTSASNAQGISVYSVGTAARRAVYKTGASVVADAQYGTLVANTPFVSDVAHSTAGSPQHSSQLNSQAALTGSYASAAAAGAATHTFGLGANSGPSVGFVGDIADLMIANTTDAVLGALMRRYVLLRYGVS